MALLGVLRGSGLFSQISSDYFPDNRQLELDLYRDQASGYGAAGTNIADTIANAYSQNYSYLIKSDYLQYWVVVEAAPQFRANPGNLNELYFSSLTNQNSLYSNT